MDTLRKYFENLESSRRMAAGARAIMSQVGILNPYQPPPNPNTALKLWECVCAFHDVRSSGVAANHDYAKQHADAGGTNEDATQKLKKITEMYELALPHLGGKLKAFPHLDGCTCMKWLEEWLQANGLLVIKADDIQEQECVETAEQRQERRYRMCLEAGLEMPTDDYSHLPRGVGKIAKSEGITTPAISQDLKAYIRRIKQPNGK